MSDQWQERKRPNRLERRYGFPDYSALRDFLDRAADLSEREGRYPDIGFGRDYANFTVHAEEGADDWETRSVVSPISLRSCIAAPGPPRRPMAVIALVGNKGGAGKTTLAVNLAATRATNGRTVVLDADPQGWRCNGKTSQRPAGTKGN